MTHILLTGAFGNAGKYVTRTLLENGFNIVAADQKTKKTQKICKSLEEESMHLTGHLTVHWFDLQDKTTILPIFQKYTLTGIIHLAFVIPPYSELYPSAENVNVNGTKKLVELAEQYSPTVPFVFGSSVATFGQISPLNPPISLGNKSVEPTNHYTRHKITCEQIIQDSVLDWRILRFSVVMNPTFRPSRESLRYAIKIPLNTKVEPVHVKDLAIAVKNAVTRSEASRKILIIAGGEQNRTTYKEYIHRSLNAILGELAERDIPWEKFGTDPYYLHWYRTTESQAILSFQTRSIDDYVKEMKDSQPFWQRFLVQPIRKMTVKMIF